MSTKREAIVPTEASKGKLLFVIPTVVIATVFALIFVGDVMLLLRQARNEQVRGLFLLQLVGGAMQRLSRRNRVVPMNG